MDPREEWKRSLDEINILVFITYGYLMSQKCYLIKDNFKFFVLHSHYYFLNEYEKIKKKYKKKVQFNFPVQLISNTFLYPFSIQEQNYL